MYLRLSSICSQQARGPLLLVVQCGLTRHIWSGSSIKQLLSSAAISRKCGGFPRNATAQHTGSPAHVPFNQALAKIALDGPLQCGPGAQ